MNKTRNRCEKLPENTLIHDRFELVVAFLSSSAVVSPTVLVTV